MRLSAVPDTGGLIAPQGYQLMQNRLGRDRLNAGLTRLRFAGALLGPLAEQSNLTSPQSEVWGPSVPVSSSCRSGFCPPTRCQVVDRAQVGADGLINRRNNISLGDMRKIADVGASAFSNDIC